MMTYSFLSFGSVPGSIAITSRVGDGTVRMCALMVDVLAEFTLRRLAAGSLPSSAAATAGVIVTLRRPAGAAKTAAATAADHRRPQRAGVGMGSRSTPRGPRPRRCRAADTCGLVAHERRFDGQHRRRTGERIRARHRRRHRGRGHQRRQTRRAPRPAPPARASSTTTLSLTWSAVSALVVSPWVPPKIAWP